MTFFSYLAAHPVLSFFALCAVTYAAYVVVAKAPVVAARGILNVIRERRRVKVWQARAYGDLS